MKKRLTYIVVVISLFALASMGVRAQSLSNISGSFVDIGYGSRASGMGFAYTGLAEGADAIMWNPAGLSQLSSIDATMMYTKQYDLVSYNYLSVAMPLKNNQVVGVAIISSGDDVLREHTALASYAKKIGKFMVGGSLKLRLNSFGNNSLNADDYIVFTPSEIEEGFGRQIYGTGNGLGFDLGVMYKFNKSLQAGVMVRDAYSYFQWDSKTNNSTENAAKGTYNETVPYELALGLAYSYNDHLFITTDVVPSFDEVGQDIIRAGIEKKLLNVLLLRGGTEQKLKSYEIDHYMLGFGVETPDIKGTRISAHYTYVINELTNSHRIGLQIEI